MGIGEQAKTSTNRLKGRDASLGMHIATAYREDSSLNTMEAISYVNQHRKGKIIMFLQAKAKKGIGVAFDILITTPLSQSCDEINLAFYIIGHLTKGNYHG